MSIEHTIHHHPERTRPPEMQQFLKEMQIAPEDLPKNSEINTDLLLADFYRAKETDGVLEAYKQHIQSPINGVLLEHNKLNQDDESHPRGAKFVMPAVPVFIKALDSVMTQVDKNTPEWVELDKRRTNLERFRDNPENDPSHIVPNRPKTHSSRASQRYLRDLTDKRGRRRPTA